MGLLGLIRNAGFSSDTFWWIAVIAGILGLILLISIILGDGSIFFTKIIYGLLFVACLVITVGAVKGYIMQRQIEEFLSMSAAPVESQGQHPQQMQQMYPPQQIQQMYPPHQIQQMYPPQQMQQY